MLKKILIVLVVVVAAFSAYVAKQPSDFNVSRTIAVNAAAPEIFAQVNDFHKWSAWSPWAALDANAQNTFEGAEFGVGAINRWSGNSEVGVGSMTISESVANESIKIALEMTKPLAANYAVSFLFKEENGQTTVTWTMAGTKNFTAKLMGIIRGCEKVVGERFEQGLASLKKVVEENAAKQPEVAAEAAEAAPADAAEVAPTPAN